MNILPKKRWHVRTKRNIERVRKDEAEALEKELKEKRRSQAAEREARIEVLRHKKFRPDGFSLEDSFHEQGKDILGSIEECLVGRNKEHDEEQKAEKEKFEKNIGLLTYLGESSKSTQKPWYLDQRSDRTAQSCDETSDKEDALKSLLDPINNMKKYLSLKRKSGTESSGKNSGSNKEVGKISGEKSASVSSLEAMRAVRLEREKTERDKAKLLIKGKNL